MINSKNSVLYLFWLLLCKLLIDACAGLKGIFPAKKVHPPTKIPLKSVVPFFRNRVLAGVIKSRRGHSGLGWVLNPVTACPCKGREVWIQTLAGEKVMWWQRRKEWYPDEPGSTEDCQPGRSQDLCLPRAFRGRMALLKLDLEPLEL